MRGSNKREPLLYRARCADHRFCLLDTSCTLDNLINSAHMKNKNTVFAWGSYWVLSIFQYIFLFHILIKIFFSTSIDEWKKRHLPGIYYYYKNTVWLIALRHGKRWVCRNARYKCDIVVLYPRLLTHKPGAELVLVDFVSRRAHEEGG